PGHHRLEIGSGQPAGDARRRRARAFGGGCPSRLIMPARTLLIEQASFSEEFLAEAPSRELEPPKDKPASRRVDPQTLKSAVGIVHQPSTSIAKVLVDDDGNVVEGHLPLMLAIDERRSVTPEHHHYVGRERF